MATPPDAAYERIIFHGKPLDRATADALRLVEKDLGYELTIMQGIGGAEASAGTHLGLNGEGGRAVDLAPWDHENKVRALKRRGFAVYHRKALPGVWGEHIHAVLILGFIANARGIAASAFRQIASFLRGRDGLKGDGLDPEPFRVTPQPVFQWSPGMLLPPKPKSTNVTRTRDRLAEAHAALLQAAALLDDADPSRVKARGQRDEIRSAAADVVAALKKLPKR